MSGKVKRQWNGRYHVFHCPECNAFVRVTAIWRNGLDEVRVEAVCWRHGEVVAEGWGWDDLGIDDSNSAMRIDTKALDPLTPSPDRSAPLATQAQQSSGPSGRRVARRTPVARPTPAHGLGHQPGFPTTIVGGT